MAGGAREVPFLVCLVHGGSEEAATLARDMEAMLAGDAPDERIGLTMPTVPTRLFGTPRAVPWAEATTVVVIWLVDQVVAADDRWRAWARERMAEQDGVRRRLVPVALCPEALNLATGGLHAVRGFEVKPAARPESVQVQVFHALWRAIRGRERGRLFISYARADGRAIATRIQRYITSSTTLDGMFDEVRLLPGDGFQSQLAREVEASCALVVVLTDAWPGRYWCQWELVEAKRAGMPIIVVDALGATVPRQFPYIGNGAVVRWRSKGVGELVARVMLEAARDACVDQHLASLARDGWLPSGAGTLDRAPELATLTQWRRDGVLVHPDPPLAQHELALLHAAAPEVQVRTPTQALAWRDVGDQPLAGRRVALSISDPPELELALLGLTRQHVRRAWIALARHLLAAGARLDYGGDLRRDGYTELLIQLVRAHRQAEVAVDEEVVRMHLAWPLSLTLDGPARAALPGEVRPLCDDRPLGAEADHTNPASVDGRFGWARGLTEMRARMAQTTDARVLLGGQWRSLGRQPGLAEEALLHLEAGKPIYVLGGFGGMAAAIAAALRGEIPEALTTAFQCADPVTAALRERYQAWIETLEPGAAVAPAARRGVDADDLRQRLAAFGIAGLKNGLSEQENLRLMETRDLTEAIGLVLRGLQGG